ncbi:MULTISPECIES: alpha/beta hydrolase [Paenibacillus]|uniref:alpha/beta hydrolase n=1 Tax=Paenibacillus TaxID=44249 RepID=UPI00037ED8A8|nr:alpha/beta hydrolase [Paenibacillus sp. PAMC 26794]
MIQFQETVIQSHIQSDGYKTHYRLWGQPKGDDVIILLHGGISHSAWQAPLGEGVNSRSQISFIAVDRRGSGLNSVNRGHLPSKEREIEDMVSFIRSFESSYTRIHLAGWCFGAQVAAIVASVLEKEGILSSFLMIAPGFAFQERYGDVLRLTKHAMFEVVKAFDLDPEPTHAFMPVPLQPTDFTDRADWHEFVSNDELRLWKVTESTYKVWSELADWSHLALSEIEKLPMLVVFGNKERLVDNEAVKQLVQERVKSPVIQMEMLETGHAVQFDEPEKLAELITSFIANVR